LVNYALQPIPKADFVRMLTTDLPEAPAYFPRDAEINRTGAAALAELPRPAALAPADVHTCVQRGVVVLDVRPAAAFGAGHVPGAMNIGLGDNLLHGRAVCSPWKPPSSSWPTMMHRWRKP
jgi:hypothetical protein